MEESDIPRGPAERLPMDSAGSQGEPIAMPPVAEDAGGGPTVEGKRVARWRWVVHLVLLAAYPLIIGYMSRGAAEGAGAEGAEPAAALPGDPLLLLEVIFKQLGLFFLLFALAWVASRATRQQLLLRWGRGFGPVWRGFLYSIGLRVLIAVVVLGCVGVAMVLGGADKETLSQFRPKVENTVDLELLANDPLYLFLNVTLVSFVFAGFREELWRVGVLAGMAALAPGFFRSLAGKLAAVALVAVIFGLGHLSQGWSGVLLTTVLGFGLGAIMVFHGSIWDAVLAHGFFNASTFCLIYLLSRFAPEFDLSF